MKILIIEDSRILAGSIKRQLSNQYTVDIVHTGEEGLTQARTTSYGMMLLDLGLPDIDGYDVCRQLRSLGNDTPILVLSGTRDTDSRVRMLECGADDYVTKPFDSAELQARVKAMLRRSTKVMPVSEMQVGDLTIDIARRVVIRNGMLIQLRRKEFDVLYYLAQNQGRAITREMILNHVWEAGRDGWNNTIDVHIKHLRDKIDRPFRNKLIKTVYGVGYMVEDPVAVNVKERGGK